MHYSTVKAPYSNFRMITAIFRVSEYLGILRYARLTRFRDWSFVSLTLVNDCLIDVSRCMTKPTKWTVRPAKTQIRPVWSESPSEHSDQTGHLPSLIRVFAVRMKKHWALNYQLSTQWRLIRLDGCLGWSECLLGAHHSVGFAAAHVVVQI